MQRQLNRDWFEEYFFYGLEKKELVSQWIIVKRAEEIRNRTIQTKEKNETMRYQLDQEFMLELIIQLERFTTMHDVTNARNYFYQEVNLDTQRIHQLFHANLKVVEKATAVMPVRYSPISGIFLNDRDYAEEICKEYHLYSGKQWMRQFQNENPWVMEVYEVLCYLEELEKENRLQYYSLFLDSKYARAKDRYQKGIGNEQEITEIREVYRQFLKRKTSILC